VGADALGAPVYYVGSPLVEHLVTGSPVLDELSAPQNYFRVIGPNGLDARSELFLVSGKLYDPATFATQPPATAPVAVADNFTVPAGSPALLDVLVNDTYTPPATIQIVPGFGPELSTATVQGTSILFTSAPNAGGGETVGYTITDSTGLTSNIAVASVAIVPAEAVTVDFAQLDTRRREWRIQGTSSTPGSTLTIFEGPTASGQIVGSALVAVDGTWRLRVRATTASTATSISILTSNGNTFLNFPLRIR